MKRKQIKDDMRIRGDTGQRRRIIVTAAILGLLGFVPVSLRLCDLMVARYEYYSGLALRNQTRATSITAERGVIYDRNMNILACSVSVENIYLDPHELKQSGADLDQISKDLAQILDLDPQWVYQQAKDTSMRYKQIAARLDEETAGQIRQYINSNQICGIHIEPNSMRSYPYGTLAAQVLGFTNASNTGSEGVEAAYNSFLEGHSGSVVTTKGNNEMDMPFSYEAYLNSKNGCSVILTLDTTVQACLEKQMNTAIAKYDVRNGAFGVVMNVKTGEILAMSTLGSYDPNRYLEIADPNLAAKLEQQRLAMLLEDPGSRVYSELKEAYQTGLQQGRLKQWRNRVISDGYEPGSTFKVLTMAAALDCGAIDLETGFHCSGAEKIPGRSQLLHCWRSTGHGSQQTPQALQNSCNLAFAHIALKLGGDRFYEYVEKFGIMEKTGIDLYGESKGVFFEKALVTDTNKWGTASLTSGSFGQTFKLTPLQLVRAIGAVVNGGTLMEPYIVSQVLNDQGDVVFEQEPTAVRQVIRPETSKTMCNLLRSVVEVGTAKNANVAGYLIGGKTGTSEKIDVLDDNGQPTLDKIVSFVGVAPMDDPEYIVLVALDTPSRQTGMYISGGVMAAPTVGAVMADILPYLGVSRSFSEEDAAGKTLIMEDMVGMTAQDAVRHLEKMGLQVYTEGTADTVTAQLPAAGQQIPGNGQVLLYLGPPSSERMVCVPDFLGMNRQQASDAAGKAGLNILIRGNNAIAHTVTVTAQSEPKDKQVLVGTTIILTFTDTKASD